MEFGKRLYSYCPFAKCRCNFACDLIDYHDFTLRIPINCQECDSFFFRFDLEYLRKFLKENKLKCITKGFGLNEIQ
jgi:hypothetical protein